MLGVAGAPTGYPPPLCAAALLSEPCLLPCRLPTFTSSLLLLHSTLPRAGLEQSSAHALALPFPPTISLLLR